MRTHGQCRIPARVFGLAVFTIAITIAFALVGCASASSREVSSASALVQVRILEFSVDDPTAPIPHQLVSVGGSPAGAGALGTGMVSRDAVDDLREAIESMVGHRTIADATLFDVPRLGQTVSLRGDTPNKAGELAPGHRLDVTVYGNDTHSGLPVLIEVKWWSPAEAPGDTQCVSLPGAVLLRPDEAIVMRSGPGPRQSTAIAIITAQSLGTEGRVFQAEAPQHAAVDVCSDK